MTICNSVEGDGEDPASNENEVNIEKTRANRRIAIASIASFWGKSKLSSVFSFNWFILSTLKIQHWFWAFWYLGQQALGFGFGLYGLWANKLLYSIDWANKLLDWALWYFGPSSSWTFGSWAWANILLAFGLYVSWITHTFGLWASIYGLWANKLWKFGLYGTWAKHILGLLLCICPHHFLTRLLKIIIVT